jgi:hypothetical protein
VTMEQKLMIMSPYAIEWATNSGRRIIDETIKRANNFQTDPDKPQRLDKFLCIFCFYHGGFIAGQGFTRRDCMRCHQSQTYSSTETHALCEPCAKIAKLCKLCGADIELKVRRKFPAPMPRGDSDV